MPGGEWVLLKISSYRDVRWFWVNCGEEGLPQLESLLSMSDVQQEPLSTLETTTQAGVVKLESAWRDFLEKNQLRWILPRIRVISRCVRLRKFPTILLKIALRTHFLGDLADSSFPEVVCTCHSLPLGPISLGKLYAWGRMRFLEKYRTPLNPSAPVKEISDDLT